MSFELDADACHRASAARDARFDGRFFVGVVTTGVYCRPICPAPTPKRANMRFFRSSAEAAAAGFRPCKRCRPESAPGLTGWVGSSASLSRALRLIARGATERRAQGELAAALGMGERHLRRLFAEHVGASPAAIVRTERLHLATKLLLETDWPASRIALAVGFGSVRRFNANFRAAYGASPASWRRPRPVRTADGGLELRLAFRPPLDWNGLLAFLGPRCTPGVEVVDGGVYSRTVRPGTLSARLDDERHVRLRLTVPPGVGLVESVQRSRRMFGLDDDPLAVEAHFARDPLLGPLVRSHPGLRVPGAWDPFELAVRAVLGQQVTVRAATTLAGRLVERYGEAVSTATPGLTRMFPEPEALVGADLEQIGLPARRADTLRHLARAFRDGALARDGRDAWQVDRWLAIPGIGEWTAQYVAMRAGGDPDALPAGDLGLRKAVSKNGTPVGAARVRELAESWRPWRAFAAVHLWSRSC